MRHKTSLRVHLLAWLLLPLCFIAAFNVWSAWSNARATAGVLTDRLLLAAARVLAEQVQVEDGHVSALIPPSALGIFASVGQDRALYKITGPDGGLIAGYPDVAAPPRVAEPEEPVFFSSRFRSQDVRAVALRQPLPGLRADASALVIVGETLREEDRIVSELWRQNAWRQGLLVLVAGFLIWFGLDRGLAPLISLRDHVRDRDPEALTPFAPEQVPEELEPVVGALNDAVARVKTQISAQRRFIADAAHQLRTPLTLLKTQAGVGLRATAVPVKDEALEAVDAAADNMTRLTNQLLLLARSEPGGALVQRAQVDLAAVARRVLEARAGRALDRHIDLGFEDEGASVRGDAALLAELVANLVDNALAYTPAQGRVTVRVSSATGQARLVVEDDGPGILPADRARVFERFYRVAGSGVDGSGLGLAIVREIARAHGAEVTLEPGEGGSGLCARVVFN